MATYHSLPSGNITPGIVSESLCSEFNTFLYQCEAFKFQRHEHDIKDIVMNTRKSMDTHIRDMEKTWHKCLGFMKTVHISNRLSILAYEERQRMIQNYRNASLQVIADDWIIVADAIVDFMALFMTSREDSWEKAFMANWRKNRGTIIQLWEHASTAETPQVEAARKISNVIQKHSLGNTSACDRDDTAVNALFETSYRKSSNTQREQYPPESVRQKIYTNTDETLRMTTRREQDRTVSEKSKKVSGIEYCPSRYGSEYETATPSVEPAIIDKTRKLTDENLQLFNANKSLQKDKDALQKKYDTAIEEREEFGKRYLDLEKQNKELKCSAKDVEQRVNAIQQKSSSDQNETSLRNDISRKNMEIERLKKDKNELKIKLQETLEDRNNIVTKANEIIAEHEDTIKRQSEKLQSLGTRETIDRQIEKRGKTIEDLDKQITELQYKLKRSTEDFEDARHENLKLKSDREHEKAEKTLLMDQLSSAMNKQMSRDETDMENINVRNRPMKIMQEFEQFCSQDWLDAKTAIDESAEQMRPDNPIGEGDRCGYLCAILMESYEEASHLYSAQKAQLMQLVEQYAKTPTLAISSPKGFSEARPKSDIDRDFELAFSKILKQNSDKAQFKNLDQDILNKVFERPLRKGYVERALPHSHPLLAYTSAALSLCWRMVLQQPPMTLDCTSLLHKPFSEDKAEAHFGSADPNNRFSVVQYYVYPAVIHGKTQMKKARVFLSARDESYPQPSSIGRNSRPYTVTIDKGRTYNV